MSQHKLKAIIFIIFISQNSCSYIANYQIVGAWRAVEIFENKQLLKDKTLESIILQFSDEGYYTYKGTLNYKETGKFEVRRNILFLSNQSKDKKELYIDALNSKKLVLLMEDAGKIRKVIFNKTFN